MPSAPPYPPPPLPPLQQPPILLLPLPLLLLLDGRRAHDGTPRTTLMPLEFRLLLLLLLVPTAVAAAATDAAVAEVVSHSLDDLQRSWDDLDQFLATELASLSSTAATRKHTRLSVTHNEPSTAATSAAVGGDEEEEEYVDAIIEDFLASTPTAAASTCISTTIPTSTSTSSSLRTTRPTTASPITPSATYPALWQPANVARAIYLGRSDVFGTCSWVAEARVLQRHGFAHSHRTAATATARLVLFLSARSDFLFLVSFAASPVAHVAVQQRSLCWRSA